MRNKILAGNWKMHKTVEESAGLAKDLVSALSTNPTKDTVVICPTFVALDRVAGIVKGTAVKLGAQDCHWEAQGAYTGKISTDLLKAVGVSYVILGHSEQRSFFHETDENVNRKTKKVLAEGLTPIVCVGESLGEREANITERVVETQIRGAYAGISGSEAVKTVIAYEPVWAIGTGKTASPAQAQEVHAFIRKLLASIYDTKISEAIQIQYGGSMKAENAAELLSQKDIDGGLIGGAALKADAFMGIISGSPSR